MDYVFANKILSEGAGDEAHISFLERRQLETHWLSGAYVDLRV